MLETTIGATVVPGTLAVAVGSGVADADGATTRVDDGAAPPLANTEIRQLPPHIWPESPTQNKGIQSQPLLKNSE